IDPWPPPSWDFATLSLAAFYFHPSLDVARAQGHVASARIRTAATRPNTILTAIPGYDFSATHRLSPCIPARTLHIATETARKRGYRRAGATEAYEAARFNTASTACEIRRNVRVNLIDHNAASQRVVLLENKISLQVRIIRLFEQQLEVGAISTSELI